ncbi:MAG: hypothetical protein HS116_11225 [Planctomycetes bacterium]|nr:hypothetical protein [Planctomycetota bacterium]
MLIPAPRLRLACWFCLALGTALALPIRAQQEEEQPPAEAPPEPKVPPPASQEIAPAKHPAKLPVLSARGWELIFKNDFPGARKAFDETLAAQPNDLEALEGLRSVAIMEGRYAESQALSIRMLRASAQSPLCMGLAMRAMDGLAFTECRAELIQALESSVPAAAPPVRLAMLDLLATLYMQRDEPAKARDAIKNLGYLDRWQFAAGPFGAEDQNNPMERRFAPEQGLKDLTFIDARGKPVPVRKDIDAAFRVLQLSRLFPGAGGIFYAFTSLQSDEDRDALLVFGGPSNAKIFLRGVPIVLPAQDERFPRDPVLVRTRLLKGANPILVKLPAAGDIALRVLGLDQGPLPGVAVAPLPPEELAKHAVVPVAGFRFAQPAAGALAEYFLAMLPAERRGAGDGLAALAESGDLNAAGLRWLDLAARQENDAAAREAVARRIAGTWPDSIQALDFSAHVLSSVGRYGGNAETRHEEEARGMRERALRLVPGNHQHLLALASFFQERELKDMAFDRIKACATAYPESPLAQERLALLYYQKGLYALAERQYELAAKLDAAFLPQLVSFHDVSGSRPRARELRERLYALGLEPQAARYQRLLRKGALDEAAKLLDEQERAFPERKDEHLSLRADLKIEQGDLEGALKLREEIAARQPQNRTAVVRLVDLEVLLGRKDAAAARIQARLKEHPGDFELRRRLREIQGRGGEPWWKPYDVEVAQIDTSQFSQLNYPRANHAWIVDFMVTKVFPDLSRESYVHIAQKVLNLDGINELSEQLVAAQRQDMVFVRTLNPDGSVFMPQNVHDFNFAQSASYYRVGSGSILEHAYLEHAEADEIEPSFQMAFNFNALDAPRAVSRWVVLLPKDHKLRIRKIRPELIEEKILPGPEGYTVYQWSNKQVEGIKVEPYMAGEGDEEVIPLVFIESPERPFRATGWLMRRDENFLPADAAAIAVKLAQAMPSEEHAFRAIAEWVRGNIQPGQESRNLDDVWALRAGSSSQMSELAQAMCKAAGLDVRHAFVNGAYVPAGNWRGKNATRSWDPVVFGNYGSLGRMLVLQPKDGPESWLQFSGQPARYFDLGLLVANQAGALALTVGDEGVRIKRLHAETLGLLPLRHDVSVALDGEGNASVQGQFHIFGATAGAVRRELEDPRKAEQIKEGVVRGYWPNIGLSQVKLHGQEHAGDALRFVYAGNVPSLAGRAERAWFVQPFLGPAGIQRLMGPPERTYDLLVRSEVADLDHHIVYEAPAGHAWVQVPDDLFLCSEFGFYLADFNVRGAKLYCNRSYLMPMQRVTPEKYPDLMRFLRKVAELESQRAAFARRDYPGFGNFAREYLSLGYSSHGPDEKAKDGAKPEAAPGAKPEPDPPGTVRTGPE